MAYTIEVIRRARRRLEEQNIDLRSRQNQRQEEAYHRVPRIKEIDMQLRRTMAAAAQAALSGGNAANAMEAVRQENQALQAERRELVAKKLPKGFLEENLVCPRCDGTGYIGTQMCGCLDAICRQEQEKEVSRLGLPGQRFDSFRLDYYSDTADAKTGYSPRKVAQRALEICRSYADHFCADVGNLMLTGMPGLGKTFLAVCIGKTVAAQGKKVCYETAISLFDKLERAKFSPNEENQRQASELQSCDLLIVDDLGTEFAGQFVIAALYGLLNSRLLAGKAMVVTTNLSWQDMEKRYSPQIASRLSGEFRQVRLVGEDIRRKKAIEGGAL